MPDPAVSPQAGPSVFHLDPHHTGKRLVVIAVVAAGLAVGAPLIYLLTQMAGLIIGLRILLGLFGGLLIGAGLATAVEAYLQDRWPSGRTLNVDPDQIIQREPHGEEVALPWPDVEVRSWTFVVTRDQAWVKKGSYCVALRLSVDEKLISLYAFLSPEEASALPGWDAFTVLIPRKKADEAAEAAFAAQEQLREAEKARWYYGGELSPADFAALVAIVEERVDTWPG